MTTYRKVVVTMLVPEEEVGGLGRDLNRFLPALDLPVAYYEVRNLNRADLKTLKEARDDEL